ncbi:MAG: hypothetical protein IKA61_04970 [Clostridia bacterium]|nr:hypothetical protein [Clostridia bacterium]
MYFLIDLVLLIMLVCVILASIKFGFSRNFVFGILRTIIGMAGGIGACVGVYFLMSKFGWLDYMADAVVNFFGNPAWLNSANPNNLRIVASIVAYLPFAILFLILGYIILHKLVNLAIKGIFLPFFVARKKVTFVRALDVSLGLLFNLVLFFGFILAVFGFVHGVNNAQDSSGDYLYDDVSIVLFGSNEDPDALTDFLADTVDGITGPMFNKWHESLTASPIGSVLYEYNPLNGIFQNIVDGMFNK